VHVHFAPIVPAAGEPAIDVQFVLVVASDVHLGQLGVLGRKGFAEVAVAHRHFIFGMRRRPDPVGADQLEEGGAGFGISVFQNRGLLRTLCRAVRRGSLSVRRGRAPRGRLALDRGLGGAALSLTLSLRRGIAGNDVQQRQKARQKDRRPHPQ
jgi:hypothetical protein